uniref:DUF2061 domain-containing protein n=1 Tax=Craspedostauros australis TaxID=1486917 RepID=A0A7R9ZQR0_9STRA|mmetsp:Transcript_6039/g.16443  ORF Transcript_6039/g.16443 Transcript_6039/m.16443 type:complete len:274 (+) Transcript_6039:333-1154(+)|eukprot:CAMPEP_0198127788 /NCGR_PEP_ID=MMETSP1442-20131203/47966_1 /TAXON_ID= /ORGANISM="Craspedostauros australis, Strain CCMP3328" /LENGTH=273 /DNA_ID=CAMNT_0043787839 /DNA_START=169 /DNA_END=990 /DNA_ORIENTATION=-
MMKMSMSTICTLALLALPANTLAFTTQSAGCRPSTMPCVQSPLFKASPVTTRAPSTPEFLRASTAVNSEASPNPSDAVLKSLEKKEADFIQKREDAKAKLFEAEQKLESIQLKKQNYLNGVDLAESAPQGSFSETTARSAVKAFAWRIIAGAVTFFTSLRFSGSLATALSIVGSDFFSKSFTMFIGERLMNKSNAGRTAGGDGAGRSLAKALIWRLFAICNTLTMAIFVAKDISIASKIAGSDAIFKTALMFFYERAWAKVEWGKEYDPGFSI